MNPVCFPFGLADIATEHAGFHVGLSRFNHDQPHRVAADRARWSQDAYVRFWLSGWHQGLPPQCSKCLLLWAEVEPVSSAARRSERSHSFGLGHHTVGQRRGVDDAITCQVYDACCDGLSVLRLTVDMEGLAGFLQRLRHGLNGLRLKCGVIVQIFADWHGWPQALAGGSGSPSPSLPSHNGQRHASFSHSNSDVGSVPDTEPSFQQGRAISVVAPQRAANVAKYPASRKARWMSAKRFKSCLPVTHNYTSVCFPTMWEPISSPYHCTELVAESAPRSRRKGTPRSALCLLQLFLSSMTMHPCARQ